MAAQILQFAELSDRDRKQVESLYKPAEEDRVEVRIKHRTNGDHTVPLPSQAAALVGSLLDHLMRGERVAILAEEQELTPNEAAVILGISRPLVVHRMKAGDLPFRYAGKHRRTKLKDVLAFEGRSGRAASGSRRFGREYRAAHARLWFMNLRSRSAMPALSTFSTFGTSWCNARWIGSRKSKVSGAEFVGALERQRLKRFSAARRQHLEQI